MSQVERKTHEEGARSCAVIVPDIADHEKCGQKLEGEVLGYVSKARAYVFKADGQLLLMPWYAFVDGAPLKMLLPVESLQGFTYPVQSETQFTFGAGITDEYGDILAGTKADATILHHLLDAGRRYYVVYLQDHDDPSDDNNWWAAYDICAEDRLN